MLYCFQAANRLKIFMLQENGRSTNDGRQWSELAEQAQLRDSSLWDSRA